MKNLLKRSFDVCFALCLMIALLPLLLIIVVSILIFLGRPVLFKQRRPGLHEKLFYIYKFRTMITVYDSNGDLLPDHQRLTTLGSLLRKYSLDELPQLFNVIVGDLSIVGPRPLLTDYLPLYSKEQARRHQVKPGITGWAQVNGRNAISWEEKFKLDVWYVDHYSCLLDLKILYLTFIKVILSQGIDHNNAPMPKFSPDDKSR